MNYDIIGDIHGQADKLQSLLRKLGYVERAGARRHPDRTAIFVGDFIDRGPSQLQTLNIVRDMVDADSALAVLGNHEFNAIAWYLPDPQHPGNFLRTRRGEKGAKNRRQHEAFLTEVENKPDQYESIINWFLTLPLWLDLPDLRVVHACWHPGFMAQLESRLKPGRRLDAELVAAASEPGSVTFRLVEGLTKGLEVPLPAGYSFLDKDRTERHEVRVRWWDTDATTYRQSAMLSPANRERLPDIPIPTDARIGYADDKPIFFGHYWLTGTPQVQSPKVACVDYSAGKDGPLVAYRWDGEPTLETSHFVRSN